MLHLLLDSAVTNQNLCLCKLEQVQFAIALGLHYI